MGVPEAAFETATIHDKPAVSARRVLFLSSLWPPAVVGGAEVYASTLADHLIAGGHTVGVVTLGVQGDQVVDTLRPCPHTVEQHRDASKAAQAAFHLADVWHPGVRGRLESAIASFRPDVVHSHVVTGMSTRALTVPARLGIAHVHTVHDHWLRCWRSTGTRRGQAPCGPACTALGAWRARHLRRHHPHVVIGISHALLAAHRQLVPLLGHTRVLHHPGEPSRSRSNGPVASPPTFGFLGQLNPNKGVDVLADAKARLDPGVRCLIAGKGPLAETIAARHIPGIELVGWVSGEGKEAFFDRIDCLVVPSVWEEPAGLVVLEAVARGIPVIASDVGGLPEYVPDRCHDLLFPRGDADALAAAMRRFAADPSRFDVSDTVLPSWAEHLGELLDAYDDATRIAGS